MIRIINHFHIKATPPIIIDYPTFNDVISQNIRQGKVIACCDKSVEAEHLGRFQIITDNEKRAEMRYLIYSKQQCNNTPIGSKAIVLLDMMEIVNKKA